MAQPLKLDGTHSLHSLYFLSRTSYLFDLIGICLSYDSGDKILADLKDNGEDKGGNDQPHYRIG